MMQAEIARQMKDSGMDAHQISRYTGLTIEEVESL